MSTDNSTTQDNTPNIDDLELEAGCSIDRIQSMVKTVKILFANELRDSLSDNDLFSMMEAIGHEIERLDDQIGEIFLLHSNRKTATTAVNAE